MVPAEPRISLPERYLPLRHLANGGMAAVWVVQDTLLDREVAVKILAPQFAADDDARTRFTREARAAGRLSGHPHVVTVYDAGEHEGQAFLVMALYPGGTVADRLREGLPARDVTLRWLREAADGLDAAHAAGVVHRDVKPANLLLDERDRVAVGDFGIATAAWASSVTTTGLVVGTMAYLAPEQRSGQAATAASDRYALGVVAHELLTGRRPADSGIDEALPHEARTLLQRAMALDPSERPTSCRALIADLERTLGPDEDRTTVQPAILPQAPRPRAPDADPTPAAAAVRARAPRPPAAPHRRRWPAALLVAGVLALVGGATAAVLAGEDRAATGAAATTAATTATTQPAQETAEPVATPTPAPAPAAPQTTPVDDAKAANDAGFDLYGQGRFEEALPLLQQAVTGLEATPDDIYYAYALFNLGATLRRLGRPEEAIPYFERRLEVSDFKRDVVRDELKAARKEAKQAAKSKPKDDD